jgi:hypothetical protein
MLEQLFRGAREHPQNLDWTFGPGQVVAAAAVVTAGLPAGEAVVREITAKHYDVAALMIPGDAPELVGAALAALLIAAGRDGVLAEYEHRSRNVIRAADRHAGRSPIRRWRAVRRKCRTRRHISRSSAQPSPGPEGKRTDQWLGQGRGDGIRGNRTIRAPAIGRLRLSSILAGHLTLCSRGQTWA